MPRMVALLRGINVGGRSLPMAALRALCDEIGWRDVRTFIQSGNIVFSATGKPAELEAQLEAAIERRFDMKVSVIVRTATQWAGYIRKNPFPEAARETPNWVLLVVGKETPPKGVEAALEATGADGEEVRRSGDALWIHYPAGVGRSKLGLPSTRDAGITTSRNYRTAVKLEEMLEA